MRLFQLATVPITLLIVVVRAALGDGLEYAMTGLGLAVCGVVICALLDPTFPVLGRHARR